MPLIYFPAFFVWNFQHSDSYAALTPLTPTLTLPSCPKPSVRARSRRCEHESACSFDREPRAIREPFPFCRFKKEREGANLFRAFAHLCIPSSSTLYHEVVSKSAKKWGCTDLEDLDF